MHFLDTVILSALGVLAGIAFLASIVQSMNEYNKVNKEHKRINDERIARGEPPLSRKDLGL